MPKLSHIHKVLVIGSGPIVIGQAAEFDYAGAQACLSLKEAGVQVVLVNNNPATIMTDEQVADKVYLEPLTVESVTAIIAKERPDGLLPTLGGQTGLNLAVSLSEAGVLEKYSVELLGTPLAAIQNGEDRELFKQLMQQIGEPVPESDTVESVDAAIAFANSIGYPVIVRPAYTLGGAGGGIAEDEATLRKVAAGGIAASPIGQVLIERSVKGWKEIEYEVMRDANDTCIIVCNMENLDPVGIHTGDSIVVAPSQTLTDRQYQMLRSVSTKVIRSLGVVGGCNIQFALDPKSDRYVLIEVNPRVSRSSALASKATGYPIARIAAKLALGFGLDEVLNPITGYTYASFEPALDYIVVKIPRFPFDKFPLADRKLGTQMKATGEVMSIARNLEAGLLKAVRSLEQGCTHLSRPEMTTWSKEELSRSLQEATDIRLFVFAEAIRKGFTEQELHSLTGVDPFFLRSLRKIIDLEIELACCEGTELPEQLLLEAKRRGFADETIASLAGRTSAEIIGMRDQAGIAPTYKIVDTCAAEFDAQTPYYYSDWQGVDEVATLEGRKVMVLGSGPIRIGQGIEFDYCSVHAAKSLQKNGIAAVVVNNNPETVSTDYETADHLYFEPLHVEDVLHIAEREQVEGVMVQFGGQTAINLAAKLEKAGLKVMGTSLSAIERAEDRELFYEMLRKLDIPHIPGKGVSSLEDATAIAEEIGFPVLMRPSYVIGGQGMVVVHDLTELAATINGWLNHPDSKTFFPLLVDKYVPGSEAEVDAVCDGESVIIPGIFQHVEKAGIHSGDSVALFPAPGLSDEIKQKIASYTEAIAKEMGAVGLINIQFVIDGSTVYVLEVNPRASRTVPITSKVTGIPMVQLAVQAQLGEKLANMGYSTGLLPDIPFAVVKAPVFSTVKLNGVDPVLGPEMKSTGEVLGLGRSFAEAAGKAFAFKDNFYGDWKAGHLVIASLKDADKQADISKTLAQLQAEGGVLAATAGTAAWLQETGVTVSHVIENEAKLNELLQKDKAAFALITATIGNRHGRTGFALRGRLVQHGVPLFSAVETFDLYVKSILEKRGGSHAASEDIGTLSKLAAQQA
ncbi:carbamoyl-phosphate synthase (glutamine-hydrolyzing) large subunit [Brevibacillus centrosporus]|uniref:carbamoyl-phosphate synthase (glutamine-hydrolyzing) large subunit n=1 Tax=Brevibacillus centrosporus TaxID=54910 RepID=UPI000F0A0A03|nr:carbamoyl-phosphate synthase (glutamine-hydrolyzing) large subunit [Brevibacillus centrosporus]MEC2130582.1 carbamoyl-phosphate synthase (glutamine-hydrolyzing) large subunit [Brevibacillus centrosporus]RNB68816.1 carbamoyl-phosphate synthase (glutamine-hydrolyzing) large subunit [Brevibacillus centrosporus]GED34269.1 carbamoyl phosphate synthase large subunit [Brevibacillus centrosporus]